MKFSINLYLCKVSWISVLAMVLLLFPNFIEAKKPKPCKKYGYFTRRNPDKLVKKLTAGLQDDSLKVAAIYCWITNYIIYDVESAENYDLVIGEPRSILKHRKTTCYGYSSLFKDLCNRAGIQAHIVTGYTKNHEVDINDSFFFGDHAWNAAYIHGRWYLFDATWDAGHVVAWRMKFMNKLVYYLSFKNIEKYTNDPKFEQAPQQVYSFQTGDYFMYDHLPENPIWQLTDKIWTTEMFRKDSSFYFLQDRPMDDTYSLEYENDRQTYGMDGDTMTAIYDGVSFKSFNITHELGNVYALNLKNSLSYIQTDLNSTDTLEMLRLADSLCLMATQTYLHLDSLKYYIDLEEQQKLKSLNHKNNILKQDVKTLNTSSLNLKKACNKGDLYSRSYKRSVRSFVKTNGLSVSKIIKDTKYQEQDCKSKSDSIQQVYLTSIDSIQTIIDSIDFILEETKHVFAQFQSSILDRLDTSRKFQYEKNYYLYYIKVCRLSGFDDHDYLIVAAKDTLMTQNAYHDTDLFTNKKLIFDTLSILNKNIQLLYKQLLKHQVKKISFIRKYKSSLSYREKALSDTLYNQTIRQIIHDYLELGNWMIAESGNSEQIRRSARNLRAQVNYSRKITLMDLRFVNNPKSIKKRAKVLRDIMKFQRLRTDAYQRRCNSIRTKFKKH